MTTLSRIKAIQAFESAARNGSFVVAAAELNVTAAAVGQQVRSLEAWLGMPLFHRLGTGSKRLIVNDDAQAALQDFRDGLSRIDVGIRKLKERKNLTAVTVTASQAFVAKWLLPKLEHFTSANKGIDIRLDVTDRLVDITHGEADIGIRCGPGNWTGLSSTLLMPEEVFPVCSPVHARKIKRAEHARLITSLPLIHDASMRVMEAFPSWRDWLKHAGIDIPADRGLKINASAAVIQAAIEGQGIALARRGLVADDIKNGRLLRLLPEITYPVKWAYYVVYTTSTINKPSVRKFHDWLASEGRESAR